MSRPAWEMVCNSPGCTLSAVDLGEISLKGMGGSLNIFQVSKAVSDPRAIVPTATHAHPQRITCALSSTADEQALTPCFRCMACAPCRRATSLCARIR